MKFTKVLAKLRKHAALAMGVMVLALTFASGTVAYADDDDLEITGLRWSGDTEARWDRNSNCYKYEVKLYRNGSSRTTKTTDKNENYYDFTSYMRSEGDYHFEVRGAGQNGEYGEWYSSEYIYISKDDARDNGGSYGGAWDSSHGPGVSNSGGYYVYDPYTGQYIYYPYGYSTGYSSPYYSSGVNSSYYGVGIVIEGEGNVTYGNMYGTYNDGVYSSTYNYWEPDVYGWKYHLSDGSYPRSCWLRIDGLYYCFDANGYIRTNEWIYYNGNYYYVGEDGSLLANQYTPDGHWVGSDGARVT